MSSSQIHYIHFEEIDSTNGWVRTHIDELDRGALSCITATRQTKGKGRGAKKWLSAPGDNLYLSFFFTLPPSSSFIVNLAEMSALCLAELLLDCGCPARLKWPNDLFAEGKKLAGILVETFPLDRLLGICVGIGLNIEGAPSETDATFVNQTAREKLSTKELLPLLIQQFREGLSLLEARGFSPMHSRYNELLLWKDTPVVHQEGEKETSGVCRGVDQDGQLILELPSGEKLPLTGGSLRI